MREILFRGKRIDSGEWVEGCLTRYSEYMSYITVDLVEHKVYEVLTDTVGQYVGIKDKDGKKIFEGDKVATDLDRPYNIIVFKDGCFQYDCLDSGEQYTDPMWYSNGKDVVIGNIHDRKLIKS